MTTAPVWPRPPASVRRWALVAILLFVLAMLLGAIGLGWSSAAGQAVSAADPADVEPAVREMYRSSGGLAVLMAESLVLAGLAVVAALVALVISIRARRALSPARPGL